jgi:hypothetical protein
MHDRFDRDQHESLIRQLFHVRQTTTISEYLTSFTSLVDQLKAYSATHDHLYFTMLFVDGLRHDIKSIVLVQRPKDLDTAATLALLQEEVAGGINSSRAGHSGDWTSVVRFLVQPRQPLLLPPPPPLRQDKTQSASTSADLATPASSEGLLSALKSYRRGLGLCFNCGAKWSKDHKCPPEVLLAVEGIWDSLIDSGEDSCSTATEPPDAQLFLTLSKAAIGSSVPGRAIYFSGSVQSHAVSVLIDSGSFASFIGNAMATKLVGVLALSSYSSVRVAGGGMLQSSQILFKCHGLLINSLFLLILEFCLLLHMISLLEWTGSSNLALCTFIGLKNG